MSIHSLIRALEKLDECSRLGISIPDELRQILDDTNQEINAFLGASQEEFDSRERDISLEQMFLFLWRTFFINVLQKNDEYYQNFQLYGTPLFNQKDFGKTVIATDIKEKIRAIHEMLIESWPHMVPPRIEDIDFPESRLKNNMIYEYPREYGIEKMKPEYGFVELPSLKPNARPLSIKEYLTNEYKFEDYCVHNQTVLDFANYMRDSVNAVYDTLEFDPTFISDVVKKHGSKKYLDVFEMFPHLLSDYHPDYHPSE